MSDKMTLLKSGEYINYDEMCRQVASMTHIAKSTVKERLRTPLSKIRSMLVDRGYIVLPDDSEWECVYRQDIIYMMTAYMLWHRYGQRRSVPQSVKFFRDFVAGEQAAVDCLPRAVRASYQATRSKHPLTHKRVTRGGVVLGLAGVEQVAV